MSNLTQIKSILSDEQLQKIHPLCNFTHYEKEGNMDCYFYTIELGGDDISFLIKNSASKSSIEFGTMVHCFTVDFPNYGIDTYNEILITLIKQNVKLVSKFLGIENPLKSN